MPFKVDYKVVKADRLMTKAQKPYYNIELLESREVGGRKREAKVWDDVLSKLPLPMLPHTGQFWSNVRSTPNVYQGKEQLIIQGYSVCNEAAMTTEEKAQFEEPPVVDVDRVVDRMFWWPFWERPIQSLMAGVVQELQNDGVFDKIYSIPAGASYHHSVKGGFLLHIDELLNFADCLCNVSRYGHSILDQDPDPSKEMLLCNGMGHYHGVVDYQILRAAIVLHDIGKVYDYDAETLQFHDNPVSNCLEHTLVGVQLVDRHWPKETTTPEEIDRELRLKHAIAAHHGREQGAVVPKTPEAILLHHLDMISASLDVCRRAYREAKQGTVPEYSKMLGARPFVPQFFSPEERVIYRRAGAPVDPQVDPQAEEKGKLPWES